MELMETLCTSTSDLVQVTSNGIETARYNSLLHLESMEGGDFALYACGNRLVLYNAETKRTVLD